MLIPSKRANLIRHYQNALFYKPTEPKHERQYVFYILLRPVLMWVKEIMIKEFFLEPSEAESELYLLCCRLFDDFDRHKSTLIPYIKKHLPWKVHHLLRKLKRNSLREMPAGLIEIPDEPYELEEEFYFKVPNILLTERFVGKLFTRSQRHVIYSILISDNEDLTIKKLAEKMQISRQTMKKRLKEIEERLKDGKS